VRRLAEDQESDTPIKIARDDSHLFFSAGDSIVITRLISGQFPLCRARHKGKHAASPIMPTPSG